MDGFVELVRRRMAWVQIETAAELARRINKSGQHVHVGMVRRWLRGEARPRRARLEALLSVLQVYHPTDRQRIRRLAGGDE